MSEEKKTPEIKLPEVNTAELKKVEKGAVQFLEEFKAFALKGNVLDLAVGVIIGASFQNIVTALTDNLINPILGILFKTNLNNANWDVFGDGKLVFGFGAFISAVINFVLMALVLFCLVKFVNKLMALGKHEETAKAEEPKPAAPTQEELLAQILAELQKQSEVMQEPAEG